MGTATPPRRRPRAGHTVRVLALLAVLTVAVSSVAGAPAGSQVEEQAPTDPTVHLVNGLSTLLGFPDPVEVCEGNGTAGDLLATLDAPSDDGGTPTTGTADVDLGAGTHSIFISVDACATALSVMGPFPPVVITVVGGAANTAILNGFVTTTEQSFDITVGQNDTATTPPDTARVTVRNGNSFLGVFGLEAALCLDGAPAAAPTGFDAQTQAELPAGAYTLGFDVGDGEGCQGDDPVTLAACTNLVLDLYAGPTDDPARLAFGVDTELLVVGCELPVSDQDVSQFCPALNPGLEAADAALDSLFGGVDPADASTYPPPDAVHAVVDQTDAAIAAGDASVPDPVRPQWETVTSELRELVAGLTAASYDLAQLSEAEVAEIVAGLDEPPSAETQAATDVLTDWYLVHCIPATTPSFTG